MITRALATTTGILATTTGGLATTTGALATTFGGWGSKGTLVSSMLYIALGQNHSR